jgi:hypothetical protein
MAAVGPAESDVKLALTNGVDGHGLAVDSQMTDIVVDPGESRTSEEVLFLFAPHLEAYAGVLRWLAATHGSRTHRGAFTGWCSWYEQYSNVTAAHVQAVAEAVRKHRDVIPQAVIQIDEGYERAWGDWRPNAKFPEGWKPVVEAIRAAGAIPGVWLAPLGVFDSTGVIEQHPDWFQMSAGAFEPLSGNWREANMHYLDPTHPGAQQFIREIIRQALAEGFRYFKIDFNQVQPVRFHDPKATRFQALRRLYRLYREEMGEETYLNACIVGLNRATMGAVDAMRIGGDSDYHWTGGCGIMHAICATAHTAPANGVIMAPDPDVFYTKSRGDVLTVDQLQSWQGFVGLLGGVTMTSEPLHRPDYASSLRELEICTPPVPERGHSFLPGMEIHASLFGFVAERTWGRFASVMLFNAKDAVGEVALDAPALNALGKCHLWSFRDGAYLGCLSGGYIEKNLPAWGNRLIRLTPVAPDGRPLLIGSDLHIGMGAAEIVHWAASSDTVDIELGDAGARNGSLWIHSGKPLALEAATSCSAAVESAGKNIWRIRLQDRCREEKQRLRLVVGRAAGKEDPVVACSKTPTPVLLKMIPVTRPQFGLQGQPCVNGAVNLTIRNTGAAMAVGEVELVTDLKEGMAIEPARVPYRLQPGEEVKQAIEVIPHQHVPKITLAARRTGTTRWSAWAFLPGTPLSFRIPQADDSWDALRTAAEGMEILILSGGVAKLRMAASGAQLFFDMQVCDAQPAPNPDVFWQGTCVEIFAAMPGSKELRQLYFQPDASLSEVRPFRIAPTRGRQAEASPDVRAELKRMPEGYELCCMLSFDRLGLVANTREFLLDFQVTRRVNGKVENIPLLGGPGASASNVQYARVSLGG